MAFLLRTDYMKTYIIVLASMIFSQLAVGSVSYQTIVEKSGQYFIVATSSVSSLKSAEVQPARVTANDAPTSSTTPTTIRKKKTDGSLGRIKFQMNHMFQTSKEPKK